MLYGLAGLALTLGACGAIHSRQLDYAEFLERYDGPDVLFYLDPPDHGGEIYYGKGLFPRDDFERLTTLLGGIKGRGLLSINDRLDIRRLFGWFDIAEVPVTYRIGTAAKSVRASPGIGDVVVMAKPRRKNSRSVKGRRRLTANRRF